MVDLFGGDDSDDDGDYTDDVPDSYDIEPDFRARRLFDLEETRKIFGAVYSKSSVNKEFGSFRIEEPKDRSYETVQTREGGEITDATVVWPLEDGPFSTSKEADLEGERFPPSSYVWTHIYGREQPTGEDATEMYTFDFNSEELYSWRIERRLSEAEESISQQMGDAVVPGGEPDSDVSSTSSTETIADDEIPVGEAYEPEGFEWSDLGVTDGKLDQLKRSIQYPLQQPELFELAGVDPDGVLLHGPPGTGKTLTAKIAASQADANVIQVSGADLYGELMGQSEENMNMLYEAAREHAPSLILMDEIDQIASKRGGSVNESSDRIVGQMLQELDGFTPTDQVLTVGTTNRLDMLDDAIKRGGRLGNQIEMSKPPRSAREDIFRIKTSTGVDEDGILVEEDLDYEELAHMTRGYTGADIEEALETAAKRNISRVKSENDNVTELGQHELMEDIRVSNGDVEDLLEERSEEDRDGGKGFR
jgi:AAA+ superfamily predicted ATPase